MTETLATTNSRRMLTFLGLVTLSIGVATLLHQDQSQQTSFSEYKTPDHIAGLDSFIAGQAIYSATCYACHQANGKGIPHQFPPLAQSDYLMDDLERAISGVIYGFKGPMTVNGNTYKMVMTPSGLSDQEVADVMTFILNSWGNKAEPVLAERVTEVRQQGPRDNAVLTN